MLEHSIINIINNYPYFFLNKKNVVGIGLGHKHIKNLNTKIPALHVLVSKKIPKNQLYKHDLIPEKFLGVETDVIETGKFSPFNSNIKNNNNKILSSKPLISRVRPLQGGYSIGASGTKATGTLGCIVFDNHYNAPHILSNNHVLARKNTLPIGYTILQPSVKDFGNFFINRVAILSKYIPLKFGYNLKKNELNTMDCAIAQLLPNVRYNTNIYNIGPVLKTSPPILGENVQKSGRSSGYTIGTIKTINVFTPFQFQNGETLEFGNQIICTNLGKAGDSGSLIVDFSNRAIGLYHSGNEYVATISPIDAILKALDIHF